MDSGQVRGEKRWPMAVTLLVAMAIPLLLPARFSLGAIWLVPAVEAVLVVALIIADPGLIDRRSTVVRIISIAIVAVLVVDATGVTLRLVEDIIEGGPETKFSCRPAPRRLSRMALYDHRLRLPLLGT